MNILFLCSSNIFRSQMAEAYFNNLSKKGKAESAALLNPQDKMHKFVVRAMKEDNLDISLNKSKKVNKEMLGRADFIIFMNEDLKKYASDLKIYLKKDINIEYWDISDVVAEERDEHLYPRFINARKIIKQKVRELLNRIT